MCVCVCVCVCVGGWVGGCVCVHVCVCVCVRVHVHVLVSTFQHCSLLGELDRGMTGRSCEVAQSQASGCFLCGFMMLEGFSC